MISGLDAAKAVVVPLIAGRSSEAACVLFLDADLGLLDVAMFGGGTASGIRLPIRTVIAEALRLDARAMVLAHNHPSGLLEPSREDKRVTRELARLDSALGIRLMDHIVVGRDGECLSFRERKML